MIQEIRQWRKTEGGRLNCNLDAFVLYNVGKVSYGAVVKNSQGVSVACLNGYFEYILDHTLVETLLLGEVLIWLKDQDWTLVDISKVCISAL